MAIPTDTIDKLEQIWHSLSELCAGLTEAQWKTLTVLPRWTVQDNLSHLIGTERALQGLPSTEHRTTELDHTRNPIGEANEHEVDVRRSLPGADVLADDTIFLSPAAESWLKLRDGAALSRIVKGPRASRKSACPRGRKTNECVS